jgi:hypothetical protein
MDTKSQLSKLMDLVAAALKSAGVRKAGDISIRYSRCSFGGRRLPAGDGNRRSDPGCH